MGDRAGDRRVGPDPERRGPMGGEAISVRRGRRRLVGIVAGVAASALVVGIVFSSTRTAEPPATNTTLPPSGDGLLVVADLPYAADGPALDAFLPDPAPAGPVPALVLVHGGGWVDGDRVAFAGVAARAVRELGWAAFSISYRLADGRDGGGWPEEFRDTQAAVRFVAANADALDIDPARIVLVGESAGGNLAALVSSLGTVDPSGPTAPTVTAAAVRPDGAPLAAPRGDLDVPVAAVALWSAPTDLAPLDPPAPGAPAPACGANRACAFVWDGGVVERYLGCPAAACPASYAEASPLTHVSAATRPTFLANATDELVPLSQATDYVDALSSAGVPHHLEVVDGTFHGLQLAEGLWAPTMRFLAERVDPSRLATIDVPRDGVAGIVVTGGVGALLALSTLVVLVLRRRRHVLPDAST
jgi:acetyl esterase/lipase